MQLQRNYSAGWLSSLTILGCIYLITRKYLQPNKEMCTIFNKTDVLVLAGTSYKEFDGDDVFRNDFQNIWILSMYVFTTFERFYSSVICYEVNKSS